MTNIFIAFSDKDKSIKEGLLRQMDVVRDIENWNIWNYKEILAGEEWEGKIIDKLDNSDIIILLLSPDFFSSRFIIEKELPKVIEKYEAGDCQIIPVIARPCDWKGSNFGKYLHFGQIQALPEGESPISSWQKEDEAFYSTFTGIKTSINAFKKKKLEVKNEKLRLEKIAKEKLEREQKETIAWRKADEANTETGWESFIQNFKESSRGFEAKKNLKKLVDNRKTQDAEDAKKERAKKEGGAWKDAEITNSEEAWKKFIKEFQDSSFLAIAKSNLKKLENSRFAAVQEKETVERKRLEIEKEQKMKAQAEHERKFQEEKKKAEEFQRKKDAEAEQLRKKQQAEYDRQMLEKEKQRAEIVKKTVLKEESEGKFKEFQEAAERKKLIDQGYSFLLAIVFFIGFLFIVRLCNNVQISDNEFNDICWKNYQINRFLNEKCSGSTPAQCTYFSQIKSECKKYMGRETTENLIIEKVIAPINSERQTRENIDKMLNRTISY